MSATDLQRAMLIWHYTVGRYAERILAEGVIRPDKSERGSRPVTWFSANPSYEPTALKRLKRVGETEQSLWPLSFEEQDRLLGGNYRFGIPRTSALPWVKCCAKAQIEKRERLGLEAVGRDYGGKPSEWYGVLGAVLIEDVQTVERWQAGEWKPCATKLEASVRAGHA